MLKSIALRVPVRALAWLGVFSILVHLFVLASVCSAMGLERGYGEDEDIAFERRRAFEPRAPQWFPDGAHIAFGHAGGVYVIDSAGSRLHLIDGGGDGLDLAYAPSVSPDGSKLAYSAYKKRSTFLFWDESEGWEIVTAKPEGSGQRRITENDRIDINPVWSPDGTSIVVGSRRLRISVMAADGSESRSIVSPADVVWSSFSGPPVLSPDGSHIAFVAEEGEDGWVMYVVGVDGSGLVRLEDQMDPGLPAWSPDGRRIAFAKREFRSGDYPFGTAAGVYTIGLDGSEPREVISFPTLRLSVTDSISWSPDGSRILFGSYVIEADGAPQTLRHLGPGNHASWSPDGSRIVVYTGSDSTAVLYTVARDGSDGRILVEQAEDGSLIAAKSRPLP